MRLYEALFLVDPKEAAQDWDGLVQHILGLFGKHGATVVRADKWRERKLAYDVAGNKRGIYYLAYFRSPGEAIAEILRDANLSERILRVLIVKYDGTEEQIQQTLIFGAADEEERDSDGERDDSIYDRRGGRRFREDDGGPDGRHHRDRSDEEAVRPEADATVDEEGLDGPPPDGRRPPPGRVRSPADA
ncbi:MAG: 30S ribosomal protein S6 [Planctomycetes bacterium]|nr:30S ribosomal protein S6 [Planctomycetota bacterium]